MRRAVVLAAAALVAAAWLGWLGWSTAEPACVAIESDAECNLLAVSAQGDATANPWCMGVTCVGGVGVSGTGDSYGAIFAISGVGNAGSDNHAVSVVGNAGGGHSAHSVGITVIGDTFGLWSVSVFGQAHGHQIAVSGVGGTTSGGQAITGYGSSEGATAVSGVGDSRGTTALSGEGNAASCDTSLLCTAATGYGTASGSLAVSAWGSSSASHLAVTGLGDAACEGFACAAVAPLGDSSGEYAVSGLGHASGPVAVGVCDVATSAAPAFACPTV